MPADPLDIEMPPLERVDDFVEININEFQNNINENAIFVSKITQSDLSSQDTGCFSPLKSIKNSLFKMSSKLCVDPIVQKQVFESEDCGNVLTSLAAYVTSNSPIPITFSQFVNVVNTINDGKDTVTVKEDGTKQKGSNVSVVPTIDSKRDSIPESKKGSTLEDQGVTIVPQPNSTGPLKIKVSRKIIEETEKQTVLNIQTTTNNKKSFIRRVLDWIKKMWRGFVKGFKDFFCEPLFQVDSCGKVGLFIIKCATLSVLIIMVIALIEYLTKSKIPNEAKVEIWEDVGKSLENSVEAMKEDV